MRTRIPSLVLVCVVISCTGWLPSSITSLTSSLTSCSSSLTSCSTMPSLGHSGIVGVDAARPSLPKTSMNASVTMVEGLEGVKEVVGQHKFLFLVFSTPTCGECVKLNRELNETVELVTRVKGMKHCWVAYVDGNKYPEVSDEFNITQYPSIRYIKDHDYSEGAAEVVIPDSAEEFIAEMREHVGMQTVDASKSLFEMEELLSWLFWRGTPTGLIKPAVIIYINPQTMGTGNKDNVELFQAFSAVNKQRRYRKEFRFAQCATPEVLEAFNMSLTNTTIKLYKDYDERSEIYEGDINALAFARWLKTRARPTTIPYPVDVFHLRKLLSEEKTILHIFLTSAQADDPLLFRDASPRLSEAVRALEAEGVMSRGDIVVTMSDGERYKGWLKPFGIDPSELPAVGLFDLLDEAHYRLPGTLSLMKDVSREKLEMTVKEGEDVPTYEGEDGFRMARPSGGDDRLDIDPVADFIRDYFQDKLSAEVVDLDEEEDPDQVYFSLNEEGDEAEFVSDEELFKSDSDASGSQPEESS